MDLRFYPPINIEHVEPKELRDFLLSRAQRHSLFTDGIKPSPDGRWIALQDYLTVASLLERFADLYGESLLAINQVEAGRALWRDYYQFSGRHMILTDEGWEPGEAKQSYLDEVGPEAILDEVNAPVAPDAR